MNEATAQGSAICSDGRAEVGEAGTFEVREVVAWDLKDKGTHCVVAKKDCL